MPFPLHLHAPPTREHSDSSDGDSSDTPMHYYVWEQEERPSKIDVIVTGLPPPPPRSISNESELPLLNQSDILNTVAEGYRSNEVADASTPQRTDMFKSSEKSIVDVETPTSELATPTEYHDQWILAPLAVTILKMKLKKKLPVQHEKKETKMQFFMETLIPFIFAGTGLVFAGLLIAKSKEWAFFQQTSGALMLVPVLFGLKGNLEMTLASRLSTLANLGFMDTSTQKRQVLISNLALIQVQAIVISSIAITITVLTMYFDPVMTQSMTYPRIVHLYLSGVSTASVASYVLGALMFSVVCLARKYKINPDNITTPVAASLGDVMTLMFMLGLGTAFLQIRDSHPQVLTGILGLFYLSAVAGAFIAARDQFTVEVLKNGWWAVLTAMLISVGAGFGFEKSIEMFKIETYQPVINGVGGNLAAVQASRISTHLHWRRKHKMEEIGKLVKYCNPLHAFLGSHEDSVAARILIGLAVPGLLGFFGVLFLGSKVLGIDVHVTIPFVIGFLIVGLVQVLILLFVCQWLVRTMWKFRIDPDNSAIPILTALGDLLGQVLLAGCFFVMVNAFGDTNFYATEHLTKFVDTA